MTSRERFMAALEGRPVDRLPVISVCQHATYATSLEALKAMVDVVKKS